MLAKIYH